jgi:hypothetical protein
VAFHADQSSHSSQKGNCAAQLWCLGGSEAHPLYYRIILAFSTLEGKRIGFCLFAFFSENAEDITVESKAIFPLQEQKLSKG